MDRNELRFRILFEYYQELHSEWSEQRDDDAYTKIKNMDLQKYEKNAAKIWLIDSGYVHGSLTPYSGSPIPIPIISRINDRGINWIESIMNTAFTEIKDKFKDITKLDKTDRIKKFANECVNNPITNEMCRITFEAIRSYLSTQQI